MSTEQRGRSRRAAALNHRICPPRPGTPPPPSLPSQQPPPPQGQPPRPSAVAMSATAAAAAAPEPALTGTPRRSNNTNNRQSSVPAAAAARTPVPTSVQVQRRPRSPAFSAASSISIGASASAAAAAMDIDNASTTSTASTITTSTVMQQDNTADILALAQADNEALGDGNDSDCEHNGGDIFVSERDWEHMLDEDEEEEDDGRTTTIEGAPNGWEPTAPPPDFVPPVPKDDCPPWEEVDTMETNPGGWSPYTYQPRYTAQGKYKGHFTPTGATVVPWDDLYRNHSINGWDVSYGRWSTSSDTPHRHGAGKDNIRPEERKGCLDGKLLEKMGLNKERMKGKDFLFFHQLLFPIGDTTLSDIDDDPRMDFYTQVAYWSNKYAVVDKNIGRTGYGHNYKMVTPWELVRWDGINLRHGVLGGGNIHHRFVEGDPAYDPVIAESMAYSRWLEIKSVIKLNDNSADNAKRNSPSFDPANKYDYIFKVFISNMNAVIEKASLDVTIDETTWANMSYGGEVLYRVKGKPGVTKGGQTTMAYDGYRKYPLAYIHRHSLQPRPRPFTQQGPSEVYHLFNMLNPLVVGNQQQEGDKRRQFFSEAPHVVADNHFSGCHIIDFLGKNGWGATMTCRRDRLIDGIDKSYFNHEKKAVDGRSKVARFENPIIFSKTFAADPANGAKACERTHTSFQSTGSTNISQVNAANDVYLYVRGKKRGVGASMKIWAIEMNQPRATYLTFYGQIDTVDLMAKGIVNFVSWKYWHSPMNHCKSMACVSEYEMYLECAEGGLNPDWKLSKDEIVSFRDFRLQQSEQMCKYRPSNLLYPGDGKFRQSTQQKKKRRGQASRSVGAAGYEVSAADLQEAISSGRLCSQDFDELRKHVESVCRKENKSKCAVCGKKTHYCCKLCNMQVCFIAHGSYVGGKCLMDLHDVKCYGLLRADAPVQKNWKEPSPYQRKKQADHINSLL